VIDQFHIICSESCILLSDTAIAVSGNTEKSGQ